MGVALIVYEKVYFHIYESIITSCHESEITSSGESEIEDGRDDSEQVCLNVFWLKAELSFLDERKKCI